MSQRLSHPAFDEQEHIIYHTPTSPARGKPRCHKMSGNVRKCQAKRDPHSLPPVIPAFRGIYRSARERGSNPNSIYVTSWSSKALPARNKCTTIVTSIGTPTEGEIMNEVSKLPSSDFGGQWTIEKLEILEKYLNAYTTALKKQSFKLMYIDAFAGTGEIALRHEDEDARAFIEGSARLALKIADKPFDRLIFVEKDPQRYARLESLRKENQGRVIETENVNANSFLDTWILFPVSAPGASVSVHSGVQEICGKIGGSGGECSFSIRSPRRSNGRRSRG